MVDWRTQVVLQNLNVIVVYICVYREKLYIYLYIYLCI